MKNIVIVGGISLLVLVFFYAGLELRTSSQRELAKDSAYITGLAQADALQALKNKKPAMIVVMRGWSGDTPNIEDDYHQKCLRHLYKNEVWVGNSDYRIPENELGSRPRNTELYAKIYNETIANQVKDGGYEPAKKSSGAYNTAVLSPSAGTANPLALHVSPKPRR
jgi:hypothetical protein